jgi:hypothetical protein
MDSLIRSDSDCAALRATNGASRAVGLLPAGHKDAMNRPASPHSRLPSTSVASPSNPAPTRLHVAYTEGYAAFFIPSPIHNFGR